MDFPRKKNTENKDAENERGAFGFEEKVASLFQPDTTLAAQYFDSLRRKTELYPEKTLMLAVLEDGIRSFQDTFDGDHGRNKQLFQETEAWIFGGGDDWLFSFENVCATLGLNPDYVRKGLLRWKAAKMRERERAQSGEPRKLAS
jgi:hypothetical protein